MKPPADRAGATTRDPRIEVIAIFGPTASGKSAVAEAVADALGTEVVSADALQVYRGLPVLTNQPERPTRLVGIRPLDAQMTVGEYAPLAHAQIDALVDECGTAVVSGGTGLYLRAALAELAVPPRVGEEMLAETVRTVDEDRAAAHARLESLDPAAAAVIHPNDTQRLVRALSLAESGSSVVPLRDRLWATETRRTSLVVGLEIAAEVLERRIRTRAERMFAVGVVDEVRAALDAPLARTVEKTLGLREIAALPPGEALERIVVRTRRYAAYQQKWMRRIPNVVLLDGDREATEVAAEVLALARS